MRSDCEQVRSTFLDVIDGALGAAEERAIRDHLAECRACEDEFAAISDARSSLPEAKPLQPPPHVRRQVFAIAGHPSRPMPGSGRRRAGRGRGQWIAVGAIVTGLAALLVVGVMLSPENALMVPGDDVPTFQAVDVSSGAELSLADFEGEVVLLNIWATWCAPCEAEMPSMERLHRQLGPQGLRVVAVSVDQESTHKVKRWADERDLTFTILHDRTGAIERLYQTTGVPESFVIDRHGRLLKREIGPREWDGPRQTALFRRLLAGGS